jgi:hypothetical protein
MATHIICNNDNDGADKLEEEDVELSHVLIIEVRNGPCCSISAALVVVTTIRDNTLTISVLRTLFRINDGGDDGDDGDVTVEEEEVVDAINAGHNEAVIVGNAVRAASFVAPTVSAIHVNTANTRTASFELRNAPNYTLLIRHKEKRERERERERVYQQAGHQ